MNIELKKMWEEKRVLDKEIDELEVEMLRAYNENEFDKLPILKKTYEKKKIDRATLRQIMVPLIMKPGYMWDHK